MASLDPPALLLPLAVAAGLDFPLLLLLPWLLSLVPGVGPQWVDAMGGLASPLPATLGAALILTRRLLRGMPWAAPALEVVIAGAGVLSAALLPWLLSSGPVALMQGSPEPGLLPTPLRLDPAMDPAMTPAADMAMAGAIVPALSVALALAMARLGSLALERHAPGFPVVPGTRICQASVWRWLPAAAVAALLGISLASTAAEPLAALVHVPSIAAAVLALALLLAGWQGFRTALFLLGRTWRWGSAIGSRHPSGRRRRARPAALLGDGPSGVRWGVLHWNGPDVSFPSFRYRSLAGSWEMELESYSLMGVQPGPLLWRVEVGDPVDDAPGDPSRRRIFLTSALTS